LLLGLAHGRSGAAADALRAAGLDAAKLRKLTVTQLGSAPLDADSLAVLGIDLDEVRRAAEAAFGPGALDRPARSAGSRTTRARMTPDAKEAISLGLRVAQSGHDRAFTAGHLLAGLIDQGDNEAVQLLAAAGVDPAALRADVMRRMAAAA
jgi:ATP-dependent Clp protease ATP-binding subunit ClpA